MRRTHPLKRVRQELEDDIKPKKDRKGDITKRIKVEETKIEIEESKDEITSVEVKNEESESDNSFKENQENELSEYEKMVQKNREEKMAFLQSLKIDEVKEEFKEAVISVTPKPKPKKSYAIKKHRAAELAPIRKSRRLAKLDIDLSEASLYARAVAEADNENKQEVEMYRKNKKKPHKSTVLKLIYNKPLEETKPISEVSRVLPADFPFEQAINVRDDFSDFVSTFDFSVSENREYNTDYATHFKQMTIKESGVAKLVPTRITSLAVHPSIDQFMVVAGSKYGHLGFWNVTSNTNPILFLPHSGGITNLKINPYNTFQIISSSYDGTLRCGDMDKKSFIEIYNVSEETSCTYFDFVSASTLLVSQRNGNVSVIDVRYNSQKSEKKHACHEYSVKTVHAHPVNKNLFLTADSKGTIKLWDLRKLQKKSVIDISHHKRTIASAFFSPVSGNFILTTSADDSLCLFDSSNLEKEILFKKSIKHNNWTGRWLTPFKATWLPNSDDMFVVGSMNNPRRIEIFNTSGSNVYNFTNEDYLNSVTSVNEFHPSLNVLAGGNSSGKVFIFGDKTLKL